MEKVFGRFIIVLSVLTIINPVVCSMLGQESKVHPSFLAIVLFTVVTMFVFGTINRKKIHGTPENTAT